MGSNESPTPANSHSENAGRSVTAKRSVKVPGLHQFEMDGIEFEICEPLLPSQSRTETLRGIKDDLDSLAKEWKQKQTTREPPHPPIVRQPPTGTAVPATSTPKLEPNYEGDSYANVSWKPAPYGDFVFANNPEVAEIVSLLDNRAKAAKPVEGFLGLKLHGFDAFGKGPSIIVGAHSYKISSGQSARFLNRTLAKPKETEKK